MITIVKFGRKKVTCNHCDSVLQYDKEDIDRRPVFGQEEWKNCVKCPVCGRFVWLE